MKIVVIGATGNIGRRVVKEALERGHEVVGVVRNPDAAQSPDARVRLVKGDATAAADVARVAKGADAVVSAISPRAEFAGASRAFPRRKRACPDRGPPHGRGTKRVLFVGGAGSLEVSPASRSSTSRIPRGVQSRGAARGARHSRCGAARPEGSTGHSSAQPPRSPRASAQGRYRTTDDQFLVDASGQELHHVRGLRASAVIDELEHPRHVGRRFGVAY